MIVDFSKHLLATIAAGDTVLQSVGDNTIDDNRIALIVLLHLERALDLGRVLLDAQGRDQLKEINAGMDKIRDGIVELMRIIGKDEVERIVRFQGENIKVGFLSSAFGKENKAG